MLAAVSEEIRSKGGSETNTEYFAALVNVIRGLSKVKNLSN